MPNIPEKIMSQIAIAIKSLALFAVLILCKLIALKISGKSKNRRETSAAP